MARILTVDDSRAIRSIVTKHVAEMGLEVDEAEDGEQGLAKLEAESYDLVVLDVTMPVMDGPEMLRRMREAGSSTPVLMLTSESKRSIIIDVMKAGIDDYILKPFKGEELAAKIRKALHLEPVPSRIGVPPIPEPTVGAESPRQGGRQFGDILLVDDMVNVHKKLRSLLPPHISMVATASAAAAMTACRERMFRVVLVDADIPDVQSAVLTGQLKLLHPHAAFLSLALRGSIEEQEAREQGYDGVLHKPFDRAKLDDFLLKFFGNQDLVSAEDNLVVINGHRGADDRLDRYFQRLSQLIPPALEKMAAACFDAAVIDLSKLPVKPDMVPRLVQSIESQSSKMGIELRLVGSPELGSLLRAFAETTAIPFYRSVADAKVA